MRMVKEEKCTDKKSGEELISKTFIYGDESDNVISTNYYTVKKPSKLHRVDGPAISWNDGSEDWYKNGQKHNLNGPAVYHTQSSPVFKQWYINGKEYTEIEFNVKIRKRKLNLI